MKLPRSFNVGFVPVNVVWQHWSFILIDLRKGIVKRCKITVTNRRKTYLAEEGRKRQKEQGIKLNKNLKMSCCTAKLRGRKGKWGRACSGNVAWKEETRAPSQLQNYLTRNFSAFLLLPQNLLGNVKNICSCCRKGWKEGVIWVNNSAGGSRVLKEELRFLQKLFGKTMTLKIFCWCEHIPISSMYRGKRCWKKNSDYFWASHRFFTLLFEACLK